MKEHFCIWGTILAVALIFHWSYSSGLKENVKTQRITEKRGGCYDGQEYIGEIRRLNALHLICQENDSVIMYSADKMTQQHPQKDLLYHF